MALNRPDEQFEGKESEIEEVKPPLKRQTLDRNALRKAVNEGEKLTPQQIAWLKRKRPKN